MNSEQLRYKMKNLDSLLPNRSVANDEQLYDLYSKFVELIEDTDYNIDIVDLYTMLHNGCQNRSSMISAASINNLKMRFSLSLK